MLPIVLNIFGRPCWVYVWIVWTSHMIIQGSLMENTKEFCTIQYLLWKRVYSEC